MSKTSRKAEKRQKRKERKRAELQKKIQEEEVKFDVMYLLRTEQLDTKPNFAKFLKERVKEIRGLTTSKVVYYPAFDYELSRVFVKFLDGHELIFDLKSDGKFAPIFYYCYNLDEIELKKADEKAVELFFQRLFEFKFVSDTSKATAQLVHKNSIE